MKLNELLDVLAYGTKVHLHDTRLPERFKPAAFQMEGPDDCEPGYVSIDDVRGWRCDEMTVESVDVIGEAMFVYASPDWLL